MDGIDGRLRDLPNGSVDESIQAAAERLLQANSDYRVSLARLSDTNSVYIVIYTADDGADDASGEPQRPPKRFRNSYLSTLPVALRGSCARISICSGIFCRMTCF